MADLLASIEDARYRELFGKLLVDHVGGPASMEIIVMHLEGGYSMRQVANITRRALSTISRIIRRARVRLEKLGILPTAWKPKKPLRRPPGKHGRKPGGRRV